MGQGGSACGDRRGKGQRGFGGASEPQACVCGAGGAGDGLWTPSGVTTHRQGLLQQTDEKGCSTFPPVSQGSAPVSAHAVPDSHKLRVQGSGDFAVKG